MARRLPTASCIGHSRATPVETRHLFHDALRVVPPRGRSRLLAAVGLMPSEPPLHGCQLFEMPQDEHLAIGRFELIKCLLDWARVSPRRAARLGDVFSTNSSAICAEPAPIASTSPRRTSRAASRTWPQVTPMHVDEPLHSDRSKPHERRNVRAGLIVGKPLEGADVSFLQDVRSRDPGSQPGIQPKSTILRSRSR